MTSLSGTKFSPSYPFFQTTGSSGRQSHSPHLSHYQTYGSVSRRFTKKRPLHEGRSVPADLPTPYDDSRSWERLGPRFSLRGSTTGPGHWRRFGLQLLLTDQNISTSSISYKGASTASKECFGAYVRSIDPALQRSLGFRSLENNPTSLSRLGLDPLS